MDVKESTTQVQREQVSMMMDDQPGTMVRVYGLHVHSARVLREVKYKSRSMDLA